MRWDLLPDGEPFVHEGLSGALLRGRVAGRSRVGDIGAIVTEIEGSAWITGEHTFLLDDDDPFREGWPLSSPAWPLTSRMSASVPQSSDRAGDRRSAA